MQVNEVKNNQWALSVVEPGIITTPTHLFHFKLKPGEVRMASFGKTSSEFFKLSRNKGIGNGLYLNTLMMFHAMCHLKSDELSVENANKKYANLYGTFLNSASLSRNNAVLVKLGLIKLSESAEDRRAKEIIFTTVGHKFKNLFEDISKSRREAV